MEDKFDISLNNKNLGIIGASMGGLSALNALIEYPNLFGFAGCISTHWVGIKPLEYFLLPYKLSFVHRKSVCVDYRLCMTSSLLNYQAGYCINFANII